MQSQSMIVTLVSLLTLFTVHGMNTRDKAINKKTSSASDARIDKVDEVRHDSALTHLYGRDPEYARMIFASERNPTYHDPFKQWVPIKYNVWDMNTSKHWPYEEIPDYSDEHYVLLNPDNYYRGELESRLKALEKKHKEGGFASPKEYQITVENEELLSEAMKIVSVPSRLCGCLEVLATNEIYYHNRMSQEEVERRKKNNMVPVIYAEDGVYYFHFPWLLNESEKGESSSAQ